MGQNVTFRRVIQYEVPALVKLRLVTRIETYSEIYPSEWIEGFDFAKSVERFEKISLDPAQILQFIEVDGDIAGYLCYGSEMEQTMPEGSICINMLYLLRKYQRCGIGTLALEQVRDYCRALGRDRFYNGCNMHNDSALQFYRALGGRKIAEYGGHEDRGLDQAVFEHLV